MSYNKNEYDKLEGYLMMCKSNVNSPYNTGWDIEHYKNEKLVAEILSLLKRGKTKLDQNFTVIVNQGPGSFSGTRISIAVAKGLVISKNVKLFGYKNKDLKVFDQENIIKLFDKKLVEKKLIKAIYLS